MVSSITQSLCENLKLEIHPLSHVIRVEGVGGHNLKYLGYVIAKLHMSDLEQEVDAMFLVVPDVEAVCWLFLWSGIFVMLSSRNGYSSD